MTGRRGPCPRPPTTSTTCSAGGSRPSGPRRPIHRSGLSYAQCEPPRVRAFRRPSWSTCTRPHRLGTCIRSVCPRRARGRPRCCPRARGAGARAETPPGHVQESRGGFAPRAAAAHGPRPPEGDRRRPDLGVGGEHHHVLGEGPGPPPALAEPAAEQQRHRGGRHRQVRAIVGPPTPGQLLDLGAETLGLQPRTRRISRAICSPRSSCRKCAAPSIFTCSLTVGIQSMKRSPDRG